MQNFQKKVHACEAVADMKQLCVDRSHIHTGIPLPAPKTNN